MRASTGDHIRLRDDDRGGQEREAVVLEVHGTDGAPPYVVRWCDDHTEEVYFPVAAALFEQARHLGPGHALPIA